MDTMKYNRLFTLHEGEKVYAELDKYNDDVSFENFYNYTHEVMNYSEGRGQLMSESVRNSVGTIFLEFLYTFYSQ